MPRLRICVALHSAFSIWPAALLVASVMAGWLWDRHGAAATFHAGAGFCVLTIALLIHRLRNRPPPARPPAELR
jgi:hypothetical protein